MRSVTVGGGTARGVGNGVDISGGRMVRVAKEPTRFVRDARAAQCAVVGYVGGAAGWIGKLRYVADRIVLVAGDSISRIGDRRRSQSVVSDSGRIAVSIGLRGHASSRVISLGHWRIAQRKRLLDKQCLAGANCCVSVSCNGLHCIGCRSK